MRRLSLRHETRYEFAGPVRLEPHQLMLRPREGHDVRIESSRLEISPRHRVKWHRDLYDNCVATVSFDERTRCLSIVSSAVIQHFDRAPLDFLVADHAVDYPFCYTADELATLAAYRHDDTQSSAALAEWLSRYRVPGSCCQTYALLASLCGAIPEGMRYEVREEPGVQSPEQTLASASGSCRDFAWLFLESARALGFAARFVSGYLHAPGTEQDRGSTHAWAEVYLPGAGWKGFDPTIGTLAGTDHIAVAVARRPDAVPPVSGSFVGPRGAPPLLGVQVSVAVLG